MLCRPILMLLITCYLGFAADNIIAQSQPVACEVKYGPHAHENKTAPNDGKLHCLCEAGYRQAKEGAGGITCAAAQNPSTPSVINPRFTGPWTNAEKQAVTRTLDAIQDSDIKDWLTAHAEFNRATSDGVSPLSASGSTLKFKPEFFSVNQFRRDNLMGFEGGKVVWNVMQDRRLGNGQTVRSWFADYQGNHIPAVDGMLKAKHGGDNLPGVGDFDAPSQFGYVFRAQALRLAPPAGVPNQMVWNQASADFHNGIGPLLRGN